VDRDRYVLVAGEADWEGLEKALREASDVAVDLETDDILPSVANIVGISLSTAENVAFYIPIAHQALGEGESNQDLKRALGLLRDTLLNGDKGLHGQNAKFDWLILARNGLRLPPPAGDPMLASYLLDPDTRHDLDYLSLTFLNHRTIAYGDVVPGKKSGFQMVGLAAATRYSGEDSDLALRLSKVLGAELGKDPALDLLYRKIELPLEDLLVSMEQAGILVDMLALKRISNTLGAKLEGLSESIFRHAGRAFNISSPRQVGTVLFGSLGLVPTKKTAKKTSYSTDNEVLNDIVLAHPIVPELLEYRELMKLKNTYADKLPLSINPRTGRIHTSFNQTLAVTGRLSSSNPNLQNIPAKTEIGRGIREAFLAKEGYVLVSADYSQIELRVMAEFSGDQNLLQAFLNDRDVHRETAAGILGVAPEAVGPEERRKAKAINFGIIYGQGPFGLAKTLKVSQAEARDFIALYFRRFPGVRAFMEATKAEARRSMMVTTLLGRRRYLKNISAVNHQLRSEAERMAINTPIQGSAADLIKIAMLRADARLKREGLDARLLLQVHDELIVEAKEDQADQVRKVLEEEMVLAGKEPFFPGASALKVPLKVDASVSRRWTHA
jgi:DNA polymerase-1